MADEPRRNTDTPTTRANKASALRWGIGIAVLFIVGVIAWWLSGVPRGEAPRLLPNDQSTQEQGLDPGATQPPAVVPRDGSVPNEPIPVQPSQTPY